MTAEALKEYLQSLPHGVVVTGHPAPDTDAVVSALFEAWRMTLSGTPAAPCLQGTLPREAAWLLGELAPLVPTAAAIDPALPLVLTDHHDRAAYRNPIVGVVDHHPLTADLSGIPAEVRPVGAATTLVALRLRQDGLTPDSACARILMGAILADTEGLSPHKAKAEDVEVVAWLYRLCDVMPSELEDALREQLLSESDLPTLYGRDYRLYTHADGTPYLGWAILKVWADACPDLREVRRLLGSDTAAPTRVAKIVLYHRGEVRTRTEWYLAAGERAEPLLELVQTLSGEPAHRAAPDLLYLPPECRHYGRKRYADQLARLFGEN